MSFDGGTAYAESDADDEYERSMGDHSPITNSEHSPIDSELSTSAEHTPTTYGHRSSADRLPETIITEWTVDECADFIGTIGLQQYTDRFIGTSRPRARQYPVLRTKFSGSFQRVILTLDCLQKTRLLVRLSLRYNMMISRAWVLLAWDIASQSSKASMMSKRPKMCLLRATITYPYVCCFQVPLLGGLA